MKLSISLCGVALALCTAAAPLSAQTLATWTQPVNVATADGALTKNGGCDGCPDAGAHGAPSITGDGYADYTPGTSYLMVAGLSADGAAAPSPTLDYSFTTWPGGSWVVRERGVYKTEGTFAAGDHLSVSVESGTVFYRQNGSIVYKSAAAPPATLTFGVTFVTMGAWIQNATIGLGAVPWAAAPPPPPPPPPPPAPLSLPTGLVSIGPYQAIVERLTHAKPPVPALGPAGSTIVDPVFSSKITRVTDGQTRPGFVNRSYRSPSSPHSAAWSANGSYFYVVSGDGSVIPFAFDGATGTAKRIQPTATDGGGLVLKFYIEPQFSYVNDAQIYGSASGISGATLRTIDQYDFSTGGYTRLMDLDALVPGLAGTYVGGVVSSAGPTERIGTFFGGPSQDRHHYVVVWDKANPQNRLLLDTIGNTLNGAPTSMALSFSLHGVAMDRSGRYVMLYPTYADMASARKAAQSYLWDTATGSFTEYGGALRPYGHDAFGYAVSVNQDCCVSTSWDAAQWQFRALAAPTVSRDVIKTVLSPKEVYLGEHTTWNNARPDRLVPVVSGLFRAPASATEWRAWDDEIVAIQTDAAPGVDPTVWRFAHHRSDVRSDADPTLVSFWYEPRPNISQDGNWVMFTSNWDKTLGIDPTGDATTKNRQDVFIVKLKSAVPPVTVATTALPSGRATVAYGAALAAAGGEGVYAWSIASGSLPAGLTLDAATGTIAGTPEAAGDYTVTVRAADAFNGSNASIAALTVHVAFPPLVLSADGLPFGRLTVRYSAWPGESGGSGTCVWSVASGALPPGLSLDASSGAISGTPGATGSYAFTIAVTDATDAANVATAPGTIAIGAAPVVVTTAALPGGRARVSYKTTTAAGGGSGAVTWSVASGALPAGIALNSATGLLSGTPTTAGTYVFTLQATDAADASNTGTMSYTLVIAPAIAVASPRAMPIATAGEPYAYQMLSRNGQGVEVWNFQGGELPPGITLSSTGLVSGICPVTGTYYFNARVWDVNTTHTLTMTLVIK